MPDTPYYQHALPQELGIGSLRAHCHHHLIARAYHLQHRPNNIGNAVGSLTLALSLWEREWRLLFLQHLLDHRTGFCYVPVYEEGER